MSSRPPLRTVPVVVACPGCGETFRTTIDWRAGAPAEQPHVCPGCGGTVAVPRDRAQAPPAA